MEIKDGLADKNQVDSLQFICCKAIANDGKIELLAPIADILPINIVKYFIATCKAIELSKFQAFCLQGAQVEMLLLERFKEIVGARQSYIIWNKFGKRGELDFYSTRFWTHKVSSCVRQRSYDELVKMVENVPHHIKPLNLDSDSCDGPFHGTVFKIFSEAPASVRSLSFLVRDNTQFERMFALAKNLKCLKELKINSFWANPPFTSSLKAFLEFKVCKNEKVILSFVDFCWGKSRKLLTDLFTYLGNAIHGIAGLVFEYATRDTNHRHREALTMYSEVECMKEFKVRRANGISECLLNIISNAPPYKSIDHTLSKLHLEEINLFPENFAAFSHWRYRRLKHFHMSNVNVGYEGLRLLALHASFWPFLKRFILRNCQISSSAFSLLLPAMVQGTGCVNLTKLDFSENMCLADSFSAISTFLSSTNLTKLKTVRLFSIHDTSAILTLPILLLKGLQQLPLVHLDMHQIPLPLEQVHEILNCLLSSPNHHLVFITVHFQVCCIEKYQHLQYKLKQKIHEIPKFNPSAHPGNILNFQRNHIFTNFTITVKKEYY